MVISWSWFSERKFVLSVKIVHKLTFAESGHPVFRATSPLSRGQLKSKGGGKLSIHFCAVGDTMETDRVPRSCQA